MECMFVTQDKMDGQRISYEYVTQNYKVQQLLQGKHLISLKKLCLEITSGIRVRKDFYINENGYKIIAPGNIKNGLIYIKELKEVHRNAVKEKDIINRGDILITAAGKSGQLIYVNKEIEGYVISSDIIKISLKDKEKGINLFWFFKSDIGQMLLNSIKIGTLNKIFVEDIENLLIPKYFETKHVPDINDITQIKQIEKTYLSAQNILSKFINYTGKEEYIKRFYVQKQLDSLRLDPEYYMNYFTDLYKAINKNTKNVRWQELKELVEIKIADRPLINDTQKVRYFLLSDIDPHFSIIKQTHQGIYGNLSNRMRYVVREGEIVTARAGSTTGTKGHVTALITDEFDGMVTTDALFNMVPQKINRYYLLFLFKQPIILNQIKMFTRGAVSKLIQRKDFEKIKIPRLQSDIEEKLGNMLSIYINELEDYYKERL